MGIHQGTASPLATQIPALNLLDVCGIFRSLDVFNRVFAKDGEIFELIQSYYREKGLYLINIYADTFRQTTSNIAVTSVSDLDKINIRTIENPYQMYFWNALGAMVNPYSFTEVYLALQQGAVNSAEGPLNTSIIPAHLYEVQDYLILTSHIPSVMVTTMNLELWESLSGEQQALLQSMFDQLAQDRIAGQAGNGWKAIAFCPPFYNYMTYAFIILSQSNTIYGFLALFSLDTIFETTR